MPSGEGSLGWWADGNCPNSLRLENKGHILELVSVLLVHYGSHSHRWGHSVRGAVWPWASRWEDLSKGSEHILVGLSNGKRQLLSPPAQHLKPATQLTLSSPAQNTNSASGLWYKIRFTISLLAMERGRHSMFWKRLNVGSALLATCTATLQATHLFANKDCLRYRRSSA